MKIITDLHRYAPHEIYYPVAYNEDQILLGDIYDLQNCKKKDIDSCIADIKTAKEIYEDRYMLDNHELQAVPSNRHYVMEYKGQKICFVAACHIFWGEEKLAKYYEKHKAGAGWLKRRFIQAIEKLKFLRPDKFDDDFLDRAAAYAKENDCSTIIMGHKHPKKNHFISHKGVLIIILKRGAHELEDLI